MASNDGSKRIDPADGTAGTRRAKTAAEQRQDNAVTSDDPEVLAAEIERTREELAETLDAIADKVSPKRVTARTKKKVGDAVKDGAETATATVKAGATQLKEAVVEKTETVKEKAGDVTARLSGSEPSSEASSTTAALPVAGALVPPPGLRPVPPPPSSGSSLPLGQPAVIGAVVAALVALLVLRRRRR